MALTYFCILCGAVQGSAGKWFVFVVVFCSGVVVVVVMMFSCFAGVSVVASWQVILVECYY